MIGVASVRAFGEHLAARSGADPSPVYDNRIDFECLVDGGDPALLRHARHQLLSRAYQKRYMLLPRVTPVESIVQLLQQHYDTSDIVTLTLARHALEIALIAPLEATARATAADQDPAAYSERLIDEAGGTATSPFVVYLRDCPEREHHYRNFLIQSSADLLAEASASALGIVGEFGAPQSALFRILIDEFGFGEHSRKHSVLYRSTMRDFGLCDEYNSYWPLYDTVTIELHNTIHYLFQNPSHFFLQVGFLLFAETAYQRSTTDHFRYLSEFHPQVDARYFAEHAHIDLHHTRIVADEVVAPLVATYGAAALQEIMVGAELTRHVFATNDSHLLAVSTAFDSAAESAQACYGLQEESPTRYLPGCVTPATVGSAVDASTRIQVGGIGHVSAAAFSAFPANTIGRPFARVQ